MHVLVFSSSPNTDGLTAACAAAAIEGCRSGGAGAEEVRLNDLDIGSCRACDRGWGTCGEKHYCQVEDGFQAVHSRTKEADAYVFVNPVYFGEMSESMKRFVDRLRRCEAGLQEKSRLAGKWMSSPRTAASTAPRSRVPSGWLGTVRGWIPPTAAHPPCS